ncbi:Homeobox-leucine zipper protein HOX6 [Capsicum baccatum]|uniref:Homeobox-leucine zipper protein n=1 Tax=Capsicum baccatum TaxID=33114 RepID=A0A2G2XJW3_CAPBA|nr:Homeobox-leucine zipper protein HOX6 [Capsicum baccatum]PHU27983.1 Homeobox-leucine zipper protein HOX6 [Capsicum chinense]
MSMGEMPPTNSDIWGQSMSSSIKKCKDSMRRRFNDEQIKSLENMFSTESRPELRTKQQLAKSLGLQPRQVAIWFQNKRARSKSKQLELEYRMLQMSYDNLGSKYELLKKEHESLLLQLQRLRKLTEKGGTEEIQKDGIKSETEQFAPENCSAEFGLPLCEDNRGIDYLGPESDILDMAQIADGLSEIENEYNYESRTFLDNSGCTSPLWEF